MYRIISIFIQIAKDSTNLLATVSLDGMVMGGQAGGALLEGRNCFLFMVIALIPTAGPGT